MLVNNETVSIVIKTALEVFKSLPDNGFRIHIEDEAPENAIDNIAGQIDDVGSTTRQIISEEDLPESIREKFKTVAAINAVLMGCCVPKESFPDWYDGEVYDHFYVFYKPIIERARNITNLKWWTKAIVRHEWRHGSQFQWLRENGGSVFWAFRNENDTRYGEGPLESDANDFQYGVENNLDEVLKDLI